MTVIDNLKNLIHRDRDRTEASSSRQAKTAAGHSPSSSTSSRHARASDPPPMQAPASAQGAHFAAYNPEPATKSEARVFGAANPAQEPKSTSPGLHGGTAVHMAGDPRERAEQRTSRYFADPDEA
jgi:hypothetical protein